VALVGDDEIKGVNRNIELLSVLIDLSSPISKIAFRPKR